MFLCLIAWISRERSSPYAKTRINRDQRQGITATHIVPSFLPALQRSIHCDSLTLHLVASDAEVEVDGAVLVLNVVVFAEERQSEAVGHISG